MQTVSARDLETLDAMLEALGWPVLDLWIDGEGKARAELDDDGVKRCAECLGPYGQCAPDCQGGA